MNPAQVLNITPLSPLEHPLFARAQIEVWIKRDDLTDPEIQGNKWRKLAPNLMAMQQAGKNQLLTFGGAFSNHIAATAAAGHRLGFQTLGLIRGEELANRPERWSHTLKQAAKNGMQLQFLSRHAYRQRNQPDFLTSLQQQYPQAYLLPEGGSNALAVSGMAAVVQQLNQQCENWTHLYTAVGTGASFAGLIKATEAMTPSPPFSKSIQGIAVLNQADYLLPQIQDWIGQTQKADWQLHTQSACGGVWENHPRIAGVNEMV